RDWSSDVCSSDLAVGLDHGLARIVQQRGQTVVEIGDRAADLVQDGVALFDNVADSHIIFSFVLAQISPSECISTAALALAGSFSCSYRPSTCRSSARKCLSLRHLTVSL